jgi:hypothetical protein
LDLAASPSPPTSLGFANQDWVGRDG